MTREVYLGLDVSLTGLGMVAVPSDWDGEFDNVRHECLGVKLPRNATPRQQIERMLALALDVRIWATRVGATIACYEDSLPGFAVSGKMLTKLLGFIEKELAQECRLFIEPVNQSTARKHFLGYLPTSGAAGKVDRKKVVTAALDALTDVFVWDDEKDAFITVNCRMARDPGVHVIQLHAPNPNDLAREAAKAAKKPRAKRAA
jgi:hypothetical protein